ncbi:hypothetical protein FHE72_21190 [Rossellomorea vietnamensis]|uniref:Uncharacterized protein n=1 Tax=Rossellomorea vietnamensis TaxID=218284 RepID=A0A6I6UJS9_9BACI|nr:hypothetical protein [Rossellomorea vietnamensis]QHE63245.1 hypothetical protein FHE72_21190 [Rossellomorea vietnamensis]
MKHSNKENPSRTSKNRIWKGDKRGSLIAAALGIFVFSLLTIYIISGTEKDSEHERYVQAEEETQAVYEEVDGNLYQTDEDQMLNSIKEYKVKSAQYLKKMAVEPMVEAAEVDQKTEKVTDQENRLENPKKSVIVEDETNKPKAEAEENKRKEEERVAQKRREEQASKPKEVNSSVPVTKEKEESVDESSPEDELYPMEFTMTDPNGHTFKLSRDFSIYKIGKGYDDIARRYGARFYYTPNSDVSYVIIGRKIIATVSLVSAANVEYKDLFIDLMTFQSKQYTREQFAALVDAVIQSGEPYIVEEGDSGELLKVENGTIVYHSW